MRRILSAVMALGLAASSAFGADNNPSALTPGKPAGVKQAALESGGLLIVAGIAVAAVVIAVVVSNNNNNPTTSTSATSP